VLYAISSTTYSFPIRYMLKRRLRVILRPHSVIVGSQKGVPFRFFVISSVCTTFSRLIESPCHGVFVVLLLLLIVGCLNPQARHGRYCRLVYFPVRCRMDCDDRDVGRNISKWRRDNTGASNKRYSENRYVT